MDYSAKLSVKGDPDKLYDCLISEEISFDRSSFKIVKVVDGVEFNIKATDAVALRATFNSILQLLIIYEKACKK